MMARACSSLALLAASAGIFLAKSARALEVVTPSEGIVVVADRYEYEFVVLSHFCLSIYVLCGMGVVLECPCDAI